MDQPFTAERLLNAMIDKVADLLPQGETVENRLKYGFTVRVGKPTTLKEYLYPETTWDTISNPENIAKIKDALD